MDIKIITVIVVGLVCLISAVVAAISDGKVIVAALEGMARQPEAQGPLFRSMLIGIGMLEVLPIIAVVIAFILLFANPLVAK